MRLLIAAFLVVTSPAMAGSFRAGAARLDITPAPDSALPMSGYAGREAGFKRIHDRLYARAVVVDDGARQAAVVIADISAVSHTFWEKMSARMAEAAGIPRESIVLAATHTHGGPSLGYLTDDPDTKLTAYTQEFENKLIEVLRQAKANLQPARVGVGKGRASVNMNRSALMANGGWWLGANPDGPSDKTVGVIKFEALDGKPIAFLINYAVHGTVMGHDNFSITADLPGATSRFVEQDFGDKMVAIWSSGAAGDQNPIYRGAKSFDDVDVLGRILGEEVLRVSASLRMSATAAIGAGSEGCDLPGQETPAGTAPPQGQQVRVPGCRPGRHPPLAAEDRPHRHRRRFRARC